MLEFSLASSLFNIFCRIFIHPKTFILKSSIKTSLLRPLKGLRLIVPGRYTNPSITSGNQSVSKSLSRSNFVVFIFDELNFSGFLVEIKTL